MSEPQAELPEMPAKRDPKNYRAMCEPHESHDAAAAAINAFLNEVGEARKRHRIANVVSVLNVNCITDDGDEGELMISHSYGDALRVESLTAYAFASARKESEQHIAAILADRPRKK